jgi:hypothetical protein
MNTSPRTSSKRGGFGTAQHQRKFLDGAQIVRDVVAPFAVAAGRPDGELPLLVGQRHGHAVDLDLDDILDASVGPQHLATTGVELAQLGGRVALLNREHRLAVDHRRKPGDGLAAYPLRRAVGRDQLGVFRFQPGQFIQQPVELPITNHGLGLDVVQIIVVVDLGPQLRDPLGDAGHGPASSGSECLTQPRHFELSPHRLQA